MKSEPTPSTRTYRPKLAILCGGLLGGTGDIVFAFIYYGATKGATVLGVLQSVAGGLLGKASREGGIPTAVLGFFLHYSIATVAAATYFAASRRLPILIKHAVPCGLLYGLVVYFFMNMVVLPLSAYHSQAYPQALPPLPIIGHMFLVGLPIALAVRHFAGTRPAVNRQ